MTYKFIGRGSLRHKGVSYSDGMTIPKDVPEKTVEHLRKNGQLRRAVDDNDESADPSGSAPVSLRDAERAFTNAQKRVSECQGQVSKWTDEGNPDKIKEWEIKLVKAESGFESAEAFVSDLKAGE